MVLIMTLQIPITNEGAQSFRTTLQGNTYQFFISYNSRMEIWYMDIALNNVPLASGIALLGGTDLVGQYAIDLKNLYAVNIDNPTTDATADNLGEEVLLVKLTDVEVTSID